MPAKNDFAKRDTAILFQVALYGVVLKKVVSDVFFEGKECGHVLGRLAAKGLITVHSKAVAGRYTFVSITSKGAVSAGFPKERGHLTGKSIDDRLGLSFACFLDNTSRRFLLPNDEANRLLNSKDCIPPNVDVIAAEEPHAVGLFRVYRPDNAKAAVAGLASLYNSFQAKPTIKTAMSHGVFGVAVMARSHRVYSKLQDLLSTSRTPLGKDCHSLVALAPGVDTLSVCMKKQRVAA